jgi:co-chaperonin GroES (HSP10)
MIIPINDHIVIEPVKHESFVASLKETYQEIGTVVAMPEYMAAVFGVGDRVYFDAWLGKKYPKEGTDDFYWLIKFDDIVGYEKQVSA